MRASLGFMDDRYTQMLFVVDLLCKEKGIRSTAFLFSFFNEKNSTNISERKSEPRIGERT